jgi:hypothetical protein
MFEIKVTEKSGKVWAFHQLGHDEYDLWINSSGDENGLWVHNGTLPLLETMVQVAELLGRNK